ncbi:hypothetical protein HMPREF9538_02104 [Klebsiella sp. MS 92-3]|nr:hypothetical protein HMPREF9538_02104 [Klebsiella sp. MS 92-3]
MDRHRRLFTFWHLIATSTYPAFLSAPGVAPLHGMAMTDLAANRSRTWNC